MKKLISLILIAVVLTLVACKATKYNQNNNICGQNERNTPR